MAGIIQKINGITNAYKQEVSLDLQFFNRDDSIKLDLEYHESTANWIMNFSLLNANNNVVKQINGIFLVNDPLLMGKYINVLNFNIGCVTNDGLDPSFENSWLDGNASGDNYGLIIFNKEYHNELLTELSIIL